jgi:hypothetical protein
MREGQSSPWGSIQHVERLAPGVWSASTAGHGGIKLSPARNKAIPAAARTSDGWYEEDCQWAIPAYIHADIAAAIVPGRPDIIAATLKQYESAAVLAALGVK